MSQRWLIFWLMLPMLEGCQTLPPQPVAPLHLHAPGTSQAPQRSVTAEVPPPAQVPLPATTPLPIEPRFTVKVNRVDVQEVLYALARDSRRNLDIHPAIQGEITLNAEQQTLEQLLERISRQIDLRYELRDGVLLVMPDSPELRSYHIDYLNQWRNTANAVSTNTQISTSTSLQQPNAMPGLAAPSGGNISATRIESLSAHRFWDNLEKNIRDILRETDKLLPEGSSETTIETQENQITAGNLPITSPFAAGQATGTPAHRSNHTPHSSPQRGAAHLSSQTGTTQQQGGNTTTVRKVTYREAASVIIHRETGVITVRATQRQHQKIADYLNQVSQSSRRQVLIEATIVEVMLSDTYQQGIEWSRLRNDGSGFGLRAPALRSGSPQEQAFVLTQQSNTPLNLNLTLEMLRSFGQVKVLSSPRLSVLNNQTAMLKVVEEVVYFQIRAETTATANVGSTVAVSTTPQSVSVGLVMSVTPQIAANDEIILNVRPTISSITEFRDDPNPQIPAGMKNRIPQIRTREIESVLRIHSGDIAVLGGLMEDRQENLRSQFPGSEHLGLIGELFTQRQQGRHKTELLIFLRPLVLNQPDLSGDFRAYQPSLPSRPPLAEPQP